MLPATFYTLDLIEARRNFMIRAAIYFTLKRKLTILFFLASLITQYTPIRYGNP